MQIHELTILSLSLHKHVEEFSLAVALYKAAEEDIGDSHTQGDADDGERCLDHIVHADSNLAYYAVHINEGKESAIHQNTRNHWDDTRDGDTLMRSVEPVARLDDDDADESRTCQRTNTETQVKTNIAITWTQVDNVAETNSDDTSHSNYRQQTAWNAEDGGEAHGRYGCRNGIFPVGMMGRHGKVGHKIVDVAHLYGECYTESHSQYHQQCVEGSNHSHFDIAVYHVAYEIDKWHSRYDKQSAGHQRMPWCGREHEAWQTGGNGWGERQERGGPCDECCHESGNANSYIVVATLSRQEHAKAET